MSKFQVNTIEIAESVTLFGFWADSNDKTVAKDIPSLSKEYYQILAFI
jgi:hypothetical protein